MDKPWEKSKPKKYRPWTASYDRAFMKPGMAFVHMITLGTTYRTSVLDRKLPTFGEICASVITPKHSAIYVGEGAYGGFVLPPISGTTNYPTDVFSGQGLYTVERRYGTVRRRISADHNYKKLENAGFLSRPTEYSSLEEVYQTSKKRGGYNEIFYPLANTKPIGYILPPPSFAGHEDSFVDPRIIERTVSRARKERVPLVVLPQTRQEYLLSVNNRFETNYSSLYRSLDDMVRGSIKTAVGPFTKIGPVVYGSVASSDQLLRNTVPNRASGLQDKTQAIALRRYDLTQQRYKDIAPTEEGLWVVRSKTRRATLVTGGVPRVRFSKHDAEAIQKYLMDREQAFWATPKKSRRLLSMYGFWKALKLEPHPAVAIASRKVRAARTINVSEPSILPTLLQNLSTHGADLFNKRREFKESYRVIHGFNPGRIASRLRKVRGFGSGFLSLNSITESVLTQLSGIHEGTRPTLQMEFQSYRDVVRSIEGKGIIVKRRAADFLADVEGKEIHVSSLRGARASITPTTYRVMRRGLQLSDPRSISLIDMVREHRVGLAHELGHIYDRETAGSIWDMHYSREFNRLGTAMEGLDFNVVLQERNLPESKRDAFFHSLYRQMPSELVADIHANAYERKVTQEYIEKPVLKWSNKSPWGDDHTYRQESFQVLRRLRNMRNNLDLEYLDPVIKEYQIERKLFDNRHKFKESWRKIDGFSVGKIAARLRKVMTSFGSGHNAARQLGRAAAPDYGPAIWELSFEEAADKRRAAFAGTFSSQAPSYAKANRQYEAFQHLWAQGGAAENTFVVRPMHITDPGGQVSKVKTKAFAHSMSGTRYKHDWAFPVWMYNKSMDVSVQVGYLPATGAAGHTIETLIPKMERGWAGQDLPVTFKDVKEVAWFHDEMKISGSATVHAPVPEGTGFQRIIPRGRTLQGYYKQQSFSYQAKKLLASHWKPVAAIAAGLFALNRLGAFLGPERKMEHPRQIPPFPEYSQSGFGVENQTMQQLGLQYEAMQPIGDYKQYQDERFRRGHAGTVGRLRENRSKSGIRSHRARYAGMENAPDAVKPPRAHPCKSRAGDGY